MKQKIKIVLFLVATACFPIGANAVYIESADTYRMWPHAFGDGYWEFSRSKGMDLLHNMKWQVFHDKGFDIRHIDLKWFHLDRWIHKLVGDWDGSFDNDISAPPASVPEPAALVLLATGILLIVGIRKTG